MGESLCAHCTAASLKSAQRQLSDAAQEGTFTGRQGAYSSALAGLEATLCLIDDVDAPLAAHDAVIAVAAAE